jgi:hypothetical protein
MILCVLRAFLLCVRAGVRVSIRPASENSSISTHLGEERSGSENSRSQLPYRYVFYSSPLQLELGTPRGVAWRAAPRLCSATQAALAGPLSLSYR